MQYIKVILFVSLFIECAEEIRYHLQNKDPPDCIWSCTACVRRVLVSHVLHTIQRGINEEL